MVEHTVYQKGGGDGFLTGMFLDLETDKSFNDMASNGKRASSLDIYKLAATGRVAGKDDLESLKNIMTILFIINTKCTCDCDECRLPKTFAHQLMMLEAVKLGEATQDEKAKEFYKGLDLKFPAKFDPEAERLALFSLVAPRLHEALIKHTFIEGLMNHINRIEHDRWDEEEEEFFDE